MTCPICYTETEQHDKRCRAMARDEATERERERCLYFANIYLNDEELSADWIVERISSGAPIP